MEQLQLSKHPEAVLDFGFLWASADNANDGKESDDGWLKGQIISESTWTVQGSDEALVIVSSSVESTMGFDEDGNPVVKSTNTRTVVWLEGGTSGQTYTITNKIKTNSSPQRTDAKDFSLVIE